MGKHRVLLMGKLVSDDDRKSGERGRESEKRERVRRQGAGREKEREEERGRREGQRKRERKREQKIRGKMNV